MQIRRAQIEDAAQIVAVHVRSWQAGYRGQIPQDYLDRLDTMMTVEGRTRLLGAVDWERGGVLVAEDTSGIVGFAHVCPTRDEGESPDEVGEVAAIYLTDAVWDKGYGRRLMTASLGLLTNVGYQQATLWVLDTNARARRFYEKAGFQPDGAVQIDDRGTFQLRELRYRRPLR
jgi:GNAT superfamily N-acetyltransferase